MKFLVLKSDHVVSLLRVLMFLPQAHKFKSRDPRSCRCGQCPPAWPLPFDAVFVPYPRQPPSSHSGPLRKFFLIFHMPSYPHSTYSQLRFITRGWVYMLPPKRGLSWLSSIACSLPIFLLSSLGWFSFVAWQILVNFYMSFFFLQLFHLTTSYARAGTTSVRFIILSPASTTEPDE